jgi:hypothetical protein
MRCNGKKFICMIVLLLALALCLPRLVLGAEADGNLDRAMQAFVNAVKSKNAAGILAAFSRTNPWILVIYDVNNQRVPASRTPVSYTRMQADFRNKTGLYEDFFGFEGPQMLCDNIIYMKKGIIRKGTTFTPGDRTLGRFYITWRQEGGKWVISEIGETRS